MTVVGSIRPSGEVPIPDTEAVRHLAPHELARLQTLLATRLRLAAFVRKAWPLVEPSTPYVHGRHIEVICAHLEAVCFGWITNLLVNIPPRFMKSLLTSVFFPAWVWGPMHDPGARFVCNSYDFDLSIRDSVRTRRIVESSWYRARWPHVQLSQDQNTKIRFDTTAGGFRIASSVEGGNLGEGGDYLIADDPNNAKEIHSQTKRDRVVTWWRDVMSSRTGRRATNRKIVNMQRLHEEDLSGSILEQGGYVHLFLPQIYDPDLRPGKAGKPARSIPSPLPTEWRTVPGELLWPQRFPREVLQAMRLTMSAYAWSGQQQQVPSPAEGGLFKRHNWRYWEPPGEDLGVVMRTKVDETTKAQSRVAITPRKLPLYGEYYYQAWDFSFKGPEQSANEVDPVAGHVYFKTATDLFMMDRVFGQWNFPDTVRQLQDLTERWPQARRKFYEDAANGPAIAAQVRTIIGGMIPVSTEGDTLLSRAHAMSWLQENGHLYLPHPVMCPWVEEFEELLAAFPNTANNHDVAALTTGTKRAFPTPPLSPEDAAKKTQGRGRSRYPVTRQQ